MEGILSNNLVDVPALKKCSKCGRELPLTEFSKNAASPDGLQYHCKQCQSEIARKYYLQRREAVANSGGCNTPNFYDPELDGKTRREVMDIMMRCKRWLEAQGCVIRLSGEYHEVKQLKF